MKSTRQEANHVRLLGEFVIRASANRNCTAERHPVRREAGRSRQFYQEAHWKYLDAFLHFHFTELSAAN